MDKFMHETERMMMLKSVFEHLQDQESREIYTARSLFSLTDDNSYMADIIRRMVVSQRLLKEIAKNHGKKLILFGAGTWGKAITTFFKDIEWNCIIDNNKSGQTVNGYPVVAFDDVLDWGNCYVVLAVLFKYREVEKQLLEAGIAAENILVLGKVAEEHQYFDLPFLHFEKGEVFIDAGGFNGDTSLRFSTVTKGIYDRIYVFEPNKILADACRNNLKDLKRCEVIQKGTWNTAQTLRFVEAGEGSRVDNESNTTVEVETISIDEVLGGKKATFIKMDVEGAEMNSLLGAKQTIRKYKPKLAISVYHKRSDIWEIPMLLLKYNPEYKFYLRIYSFTGNDTVLYAV